MKRIIMTDRIAQAIHFDLFPEADDIEIITAYSHEDALNLHRRERAHLIIIELFRAGMNAVRFCSHIRETPELRRVSVIVCCRDNDIELAESARCRANAVVTMPIEPACLRTEALRMLSIPERGEYKARFSARCTRRLPPNPFDCEIGNISVTGMLIEARADLHPGDRISCSIPLPEASFDTQLEIVRTEKAGSAGRNHYGVKFSGLGPDARRAIEILVGKNFCG
jgi:CheY-like chemotaxis protein